MQKLNHNTTGDSETELLLEGLEFCSRKWPTGWNGTGWGGGGTGWQGINSRRSARRGRWVGVFGVDDLSRRTTAAEAAGQLPMTWEAYKRGCIVAV